MLGAHSIGSTMSDSMEMGFASGKNQRVRI
jgi:hypothetical protein